METIKSIQIKGMEDQQAAERVSEILHDIWGIRNVEINANKGEATISFDEDAASIHDFQQALADEGFEVENEEGPIKQ